VGRGDVPFSWSASSVASGSSLGSPTDASRYELRAGAIVRASNRAAIRAKETVNAMGRNMRPSICCRVKRGRKTAMTTPTEKAMGRATSRPARTTMRPIDASGFSSRRR
jgi:hypothetical protein